VEAPAARRGRTTLTPTSAGASSPRSLFFEIGSETAHTAGHRAAIVRPDGPRVRTIRCPGPAFSDTALRTPGALVWTLLIRPAGRRRARSATCVTVPKGVRRTDGNGRRGRRRVDAFRGMQVCAADRPGLAGQIEEEQIGGAVSAGNSVAIVLEGTGQERRSGGEAGAAVLLAGVGGKDEHGGFRIEHCRGEQNP